MTAWNEALHPRVPKGQHDGGHFAPKYSPQKLASVEAEIRNMPIEFAAAFNPKTKRVIDVLSGHEGGVQFTPVFKERLRGMALTHNHPIDNPFSPLDVITASKFNLREMRVVSEHHDYSIKRAPGYHRWPRPEKIEDIVESTRREYVTARIPHLRWHQTWISVAPKLGLKYTRKWTPSEP